MTMLGALFTVLLAIGALVWLIGALLFIYAVWTAEVAPDDGEWM